MKSERLDEILGKFPREKILVLGDFFLDQYLMLDRDLSERSVETGLECYQVTEIRNSPGVAGTVTNNLCALDVPSIALGVIGCDGRGFDLKKAFSLQHVQTDFLIESEELMTPTYTKPMLSGSHELVHELERIDFKNRRPLSTDIQERLCKALDVLFPQVSGMIILDQLEGTEAGVFPTRVRATLSELALNFPDIPILADSRFRSGLFENTILKCNESEALRTTGTDSLEEAAEKLFLHNPRGAFISMGADGMLVCKDGKSTRVPGVRVEGPIDIVGAGDSAAAGIMAALCAGASFEEAAEIGNRVASITIQQIGTTGTASRKQVRDLLIHTQKKR